MSKIQLTLAISDYDHVRDLTSGRVVAEGIDLVALDFDVEELFAKEVQSEFRVWAENRRLEHYPVIFDLRKDDLRSSATQASAAQAAARGRGLALSDRFHSIG